MSQKFREGTFVRHVSKTIEGRVVGTTRIKKVFELAEDDFEYRIQTNNGVKICSPSNLEFLEAEGRVSRCYNCQLKVDPMSEKCRVCGWYICIDPQCRSCGCGVGKGVV